jgi:hypothetical protein
LSETYSYTPVASDPDGHKLTFSINAAQTTADENGAFSIDAATGTILWNPTTIGTERRKQTWRQSKGSGLFDDDQTIEGVGPL